LFSALTWERADRDDKGDLFLNKFRPFLRFAVQRAPEQFGYGNAHIRRSDIRAIVYILFQGKTSAAPVMVSDKAYRVNFEEKGYRTFFRRHFRIEYVGLPKREVKRLNLPGSFVKQIAQICCRLVCRRYC